MLSSMSVLAAPYPTPMNYIFGIKKDEDPGTPEVNEEELSNENAGRSTLLPDCISENSGVHTPAPHRSSTEFTSSDAGGPRWNIGMPAGYKKSSSCKTPRGGPKIARAQRVFRNCHKCPARNRIRRSFCSRCFIGKGEMNNRRGITTDFREDA